MEVRLGIVGQRLGFVCSDIGIGQIEAAIGVAATNLFGVNDRQWPPSIYVSKRSQEGMTYRTGANQDCPFQAELGMQREVAGKIRTGG